MYFTFFFNTIGNYLLTGNKNLNVLTMTGKLFHHNEVQHEFYYNHTVVNN